MKNLVQLCFNISLEKGCWLIKRRGTETLIFQFSNMKVTHDLDRNSHSWVRGTNACLGSRNNGRRGIEARKRSFALKGNPEWSHRGVWGLFLIFNGRNNTKFVQQWEWSNKVGSIKGIRGKSQIAGAMPWVRWMRCSREEWCWPYGGAWASHLFSGLGLGGYRYGTDASHWVVVAEGAYWNSSSTKLECGWGGGYWSFKERKKV